MGPFEAHPRDRFANRLLAPRRTFVAPGDRQKALEFGGQE